MVEPSRKTVILPLRCVVYVVLVVALANALIVFRAPLRNIVFDSCIVEVTEEKKYTYINDDYPPQAPVKLPETTHIQVSGEPQHGLYADAEWAALFPSTDGFVTLGSTSSLPYHGGNKDSSAQETNATHPLPPTQTFLVSVVHELHCLDVFRVVVADPTRSGATEHVEHCLRYMLQLVLCHADATLERDEPGIRDGRWAHASSGVGAAHQCRDWRALWAWMEAHPPVPLEGSQMMEDQGHATGE